MDDRTYFAGCLIGQCLGDALGFAMEGRGADECRRYVEERMDARCADPRGCTPFGFGQYTDDSQLARELMQSYVARAGFEPQDYAERIAAIFRENRIVGRGQATELAARRLDNGFPWDAAGTPSPSAGNGSAMRAGPIGLMFPDGSAALIRAAHDQGRITHQDPRCSAGAVAIAGSVAMALRHEPVDPRAWLEELAGWVAPLDAGFAGHLASLKAWLELPPEAAAASISRCGMQPDGRGWEGITPFVVGSVLWSLYSFLRTPDDYWETIRTAIAVGGDVDTTAAMAGAISGAYVGLDGIPAHLAERLTDRRTWGLAELVELADRCFDVRRAL